MRQHVIKLITLVILGLAVLLAVAWVIMSPGFESIIALLAGFTAWIVNYVILVHALKGKSAAQSTLTLQYTPEVQRALIAASGWPKTDGKAAILTLTCFAILCSTTAGWIAGERLYPGFYSDGMILYASPGAIIGGVTIGMILGVGLALIALTGLWQIIKLSENKRSRPSSLRSGCLATCFWVIIVAFTSLFFGYLGGLFGGSIGLKTWEERTSIILQVFQILAGLFGLVVLIGMGFVSAIINTTKPDSG